MAYIMSRVAAKYRIVSKRWFEATPNISGLKSDALKKFVIDVFSANKGADTIAEELLKKHGQDWYNEYGPEEWTIRTEKELSSNFQFKKPKIVNNVRLFHQTSADPETLILEIEKGNFKGCDGIDMASTTRHGCNRGPLGFAFYSKGASEDVYGNHMISFTAVEGVEVKHLTDDEVQVIWDSRLVRDFKIER